ncbi:MAG: colicin immunity domain-containing protein [Hyphomicrobium sp.]
MSDDAWLELIEAFVARRIDVDAFHDRFFDLWHAGQRLHHDIPPTVEKLFYTVEAYCPDPQLRDPDSPYEADEAEVRKDAHIALGLLKADRR